MERVIRMGDEMALKIIREQEETVEKGMRMDFRKM